MNISGADASHRAVPRGHRRRVRPATAARFLSTGQKVFGACLLLLTATGFSFAPRVCATLLVGCCIFFYLLIALMRIAVMVAGQGYRSPRRMTVRAEDPTLPDYAVLLPVHKEANSFSVDNQIVANSPVPWHPGAVKFFKERGAKM